MGPEWVMRLKAEEFPLWHNGLRIWCCYKLWYSSQMWLGFGVAMAAAALIQPLAWELPYAAREALK